MSWKDYVNPRELLTEVNLGTKGAVVNESAAALITPFSIAKKFNAKECVEYIQENDLPTLLADIQLVQNKYFGASSPQEVFAYLKVPKNKKWLTTACYSAEALIKELKLGKTHNFHKDDDFMLSLKKHAAKILKPIIKVPTELLFLIGKELEKRWFIQWWFLRTVRRN